MSQCGSVLSSIHPPRVLFVDDDENIARSFQTVLSKYGMEVMSIARVKEAMPAYALHMPECAVVDWRFPGSSIDGLHVLEEMARRFSSGRRILFTGFSEELSQTRIEPSVVSSVVRKGAEGAERLLHLISQSAQEARSTTPWIAMSTALRSAPVRRRPARPAVRDLISHLSSYLKRSWTEREMADAVHLGVRHLRRIVAEDLGLSPTELRERQRVAAACMLLKNPEMKISTIADWMGLSSARSLRRLLRRHTNLSPSQLRSRGR